MLWTWSDGVTRAIAPRPLPEEQFEQLQQREDLLQTMLNKHIIEARQANQLKEIKRIAKLRQQRESYEKKLIKKDRAPKKIKKIKPVPDETPKPPKAAKSKSVAKKKTTPQSKPKKVEKEIAQE